MAPATVIQRGPLVSHSCDLGTLYFSFSLLATPSGTVLRVHTVGSDRWVVHAMALRFDNSVALLNSSSESVRQTAPVLLVVLGLWFFCSSFHHKRLTLAQWFRQVEPGCTPLLALVIAAGS